MGQIIWGYVVNELSEEGVNRRVLVRRAAGRRREDDR
jgi:hypothetical protein